MPKETIFISSVQKEFAAIRQAVATYVREDDLLRLFFEPFLFEEVAATGDSPGKVYLHEVKKADIYLGILGAEYGFEDKEGISPTEREFDAAQENHKSCWVFIQGNQALKRHPKQLKFIDKVGNKVSRKRLRCWMISKRKFTEPPYFTSSKAGKLTQMNLTAIYSVRPVWMIYRKRG